MCCWSVGSGGDGVLFFVLQVRGMVLLLLHFCGKRSCGGGAVYCASGRRSRDCGDAVCSGKRWEKLS